MNRVIISGRVVRDPDIRQSGDMTIAKITLAVDRRGKRDEEKKADFINCTCFGKQAEFVEKYFHKGDGMNLEGRIQTGSYKNKDGVTVYTTDVIADAIEFPLSNKTANSSNTPAPSTKNDGGFNVNEGFQNVPDGIDMELPFN